MGLGVLGLFFVVFFNATLTASLRKSDLMSGLCEVWKTCAQFCTFIICPLVPCIYSRQVTSPVMQPLCCIQGSILSPAKDLHLLKIFKNIVKLATTML